MNYALGHAANSNDLFMHFPSRKMKVDKDVCIKYMKNRHKERLAAKIWKECVNLVLDDIIENRAIFKLPTLGKNAEIFVKGTEGEDFTKARQNGKWEDTDYLMSNFTGYQPVFRFQRAGYNICKPIYTDKAHKDKLTEKVNQGFGYY